MHLLPEVDHNFADYYATQEGEPPNYPFRELYIGIGFLAIFLLEYAMISCRKRTATEWDDVLTAGHEHPHDRKHKHDDNNDDFHKHKLESEGVANDEPVVKFQQPGGGDGDDEEEEKKESKVIIDEKKNGGELEEDTPPPMVDPSFRDFLLFMVLYVHSIFEGLANGLLSETTAIYSFLFAIIAHKLVILATLSIQLVAKNVKLSKAFILVFIFSVMSPIGVAIGIVMDKTGTQESDSGLYATAILNAFSTGTLIYVVVMEMIPDVFHSGKSPFKRAVAVTLGFAFMACLMMVPHDHGHAHGDNGCNATEMATDSSGHAHGGDHGHSH